MMWWVDQQSRTCFLMVAILLAIIRVASAQELMESEPASRASRELLPAGVVAEYPLSPDTVGQHQRAEQNHVSPAILQTVIAPQGQRIALRRDDQAIQIFERTSGRLLYMLRVDEGPLSSIAFSPDGRYLIAAATGLGASVLAWDLENGTEFRRWDHAALAIRFRNLQEFVTVGTTDVRICNLNTDPAEAFVCRIPNHTHPLGISPDGQFIVLTQPSPAASQSYSAFVFDIQAQTTTGLPPLPFAPRHVAFSPGGESLALCGNRSSDIALFEPAVTSSYRLLQGHEQTVSAIAYSADGRHLVSGCFDGTTQIWETLTWQSLGGFTAHSGHVSSLDVSPDGQWMVTASAGTETNSAYLWSFPERLFRRTVPSLKPTDSPAVDATPWNALWEALGSETAEHAYAALGILLSDETASVAIQKQLNLVTQPITRAQFDAWIEHLDHERYAVREEAFLNLTRNRAGLHDEIRTALSTARSLETELRLRQLLTQSVSESVMSSTDWLRMHRLIFYLELQENPTNQQLLRNLTSGHPDQRIVRLAQQALDRIAQSTPDKR